MGMSIDKTIEFFNGLECHTPQAKDARDVAVDTMRKYEKIEQIMKSKKMDTFNIGLLISKDMACVLHEITEVIEDGRN